MWVVKQEYISKEKYLNPTNTRTLFGTLDAKIVYTQEEAYKFQTEEDAKNFLYSTSFFDKGYEPVKL